VVEFLKGQHNTIKTLFAQTLNAPDNAKREQAFNELRKLLAVHETAEEMVVHPRARRENEAGDAVVRARLAEENEAKKHLEKIEQMEIGSPEFLTALQKLQAAVVDHAEHEENDEFSKLQNNLDADELKRMAGAVKAAEKIAPTHPHAGVESATANFAIGPFAALVDRARDAIKSAIS
jgi:hypothetical protein